MCQKSYMLLEVQSGRAKWHTQNLATKNPTTEPLLGVTNFFPPTTDSNQVQTKPLGTLDINPLHSTSKQNGEQTISKKQPNSDIDKAKEMEKKLQLKETAI